MSTSTPDAGRIRVVFPQTEAFEATWAAERWCSERGISVGGAQRGAPRGLLYGDFVIAKWRNLRRDEIAALHGRMTGDPRHGPVIIDICQPPAGHGS
ncbi:hypothetical protein [Rubrivivax gelatinosus]|uniref:hypothetical protein n=1 Tax=Rubrivivax gelatinosus TaxID=28068 RepID=UPI000307065B|nr:hypothetical protein [Rubrivivax gelatinosus]MBG6083176.1 hypothetical protein [Rubrivivax gelatinosus]